MERVRQVVRLDRLTVWVAEHQVVVAIALAERQPLLRLRDPMLLEHLRRRGVKRDDAAVPRLRRRELDLAIGSNDRLRYRQPRAVRVVQIEVTPAQAEDLASP